MSSKVTIADVAREAGVSSQTVSRVINNKAEISASTRQQVSLVIERLGYRPSSIARGLATNRTYTLGLSVPDIANPFWPEIARGIEDVAWEHGYNLFLCNTTENPQRESAILHLLEEKRVDGVIIAGSRLPDAQLFELIKRQRATVLVNRPAPEGATGAVMIDVSGGAIKGVTHLLAGGRRKIAFLAGPQHSHNNQRHMRGYTEALAIAGQELRQDIVSICAPTIEGGALGARKLLATHPEIDAMYCYNDLIAIGALQTCLARGVRVPEDVAVVGCDDILMAQIIRPALTTLRAMKYDVGATAAHMLLDIIESRVAQGEVIIPTELVIRESAPLLV